MRFRERKKEAFEVTGPRDRWIVPYADLVTILLALFIVLFAAADKEKAAEIASSFKGVPYGGSGLLPDGAAKKQVEIEDLILSDPLLSKQTSVEKNKDSVTISLSNSTLFERAKSNVATDSKNTLKRLASKLIATKGEIRVEGHTDSKPISNNVFSSNWELSTARASAVLLLLIEAGVKPSRLSASGYGGFRPVADNSTASGRRLNRRVAIVIERKEEPPQTLIID